MDCTSLCERLRRIAAEQSLLALGKALPLTAIDAARILAMAPRNRVQEVVHDTLARFLPPHETTNTPQTWQTTKAE